MQALVETQYQEFLAGKQIAQPASGFTPETLSPVLFEFQRDITRWAIERGRAAIFADCGLGKTPMQLQWSESVVRKFNRPVLILAPLAVSKQTEREGQKFGITTSRRAQTSDTQSKKVSAMCYSHNSATFEFQRIAWSKNSKPVTQTKRRKPKGFDGPRIKRSKGDQHRG